MSKTRILAILLALVMVLGMLTVSAFATESTDQTTDDLSVTITHISLDPAKDALGFKAKVTGDVSSVTQIGFAFRVNGGKEKIYTVTKTPQDGIFTARVKSILAADGGEATLEAYAFVKMDDTQVISKTESTSMKQTLQAVDAAWNGYTTAQKNAVKALCEQYKTTVESWNLDDIFRVDTPFFVSAGAYNTDALFDLSADTGANKGTVTVSKDGIAMGYIDQFQEDAFYFESKIHVNAIKSSENYPKFGLFVRSGNVRHNFYVDMKTDLTATVVGRMTNTDGKDNWSDINKATLSNLTFSGEGE